MSTRPRRRSDFSALDNLGHHGRASPSIKIQTQLDAALIALAAAELMLREIPGCEPSADVVRSWIGNIRPNIPQLLLSVSRNTERPPRGS